MKIRKAKSDSVEMFLEVRERIRQKMATADAGAQPRPLSSSSVDVLDLSDLRELSQTAGESGWKIGEIPPGPPTLRARVGKFLIGIVRRMLFWYTPQIVSFHHLTARIFEKQLLVFANVSKLFGEMNAAHAALQVHIESLADAVRSSRTDMAKAHAALWKETRWREAITAEIRVIERTIAAQSIDMGEHIASSGRLLSADLQAVKQRLDEQSAELATLSGRTAALFDDLRHAGHTQKFASLYVTFESRFRGAREDIKNRMRVHLPRLIEVGIGAENAPVVDVGCGRGEWLELLRESGLHAWGIDSNSAMIAECHQRGLNVIEVDAVDYLHSRPDGSVGAVTAFHVVEHLQINRMIELLEETVRVLTAGGVALFETPNPANLLVGAHTFYMDPTHRNPIPSEALRFLAEAVGLRDIEIRALHPYPEEFRLQDDGLGIGTRLNEYFYGPQDYALIGRKA